VLATVSRALIALLAGLGVGYGTSVWQSGRPDAGPIPAAEAREATLLALQHFDRLERIEALAALLPRIGPEALTGVLDAYGEAPLNGGDVELLLFVSWWGGYDPEAAHDWAEGDLRVGGYLLILEEIFGRWGRVDPVRALGEALRLRFRLRRQVCAAATLLAAEQSERDELRGLFEHIPAGSERQEILALVVAGRSRGGHSELIVERARELAALAGSDSQLRTDTYAGALIAVSRRDPPAAARLWSAELADVMPASTGLAREIAVAWTRLPRGPKAAMAWLETLPAGAERDEAVLWSYRTWMGLDYPGAMAWLETRVAAPSRALDPAIGARAISISAVRPLDGLSAAEAISDPILRDETESTIIMMWLSRDPEAGGSWLEAADLPADRKARLRAGGASWRRPRGPVPQPSGPR
jgi:hypothetical protein